MANIRVIATVIDQCVDYAAGSFEPVAACVFCGGCRISESCFSFFELFQVGSAQAFQRYIVEQNDHSAAFLIPEPQFYSSFS